jgi:hypothetical protein
MNGSSRIWVRVGLTFLCCPTAWTKCSSRNAILAVFGIFKHRRVALLVALAANLFDPGLGF